MFCRHCGSELKEGFKFCAYCGQKITTPVGGMPAGYGVPYDPPTSEERAEYIPPMPEIKAEKTRMEFCKCCGQKFPADQEQCPFCGKKVTQTPVRSYASYNPARDTAEPEQKRGLIPSAIALALTFFMPVIMLIPSIALAIVGIVLGVKSKNTLAIILGAIAIIGSVFLLLLLLGLISLIFTGISSSGWY